MTDMVTPRRRSEIMARIKSTDTMPELMVRRVLFKMGYRYRLHREDLPGRPDIVLPKYKIVVFVNGCFWHGHRCKDGRRPKSNQEYWEKKLTRNRQRDRKNLRLVRSQGWRPVVVWGCQCKDEERLRKLLGRAIQSG